MDFWHEVGFVVTDAAGAPDAATTSATPAGAFRMSRDEMETTRQELEGALQLIKDQRRPAARLTRLRSPADEPVSNGVTATFNEAGQFYLGHLDRQRAVAEVIVDKIRKALGMVSLAEEDSQKKIKDAGGGELQ